MKNNRGISIVEIIVSITLIAIIMVFLFTMLITVREEDSKSKQSSKLLINQAKIVREIENDFIELGLIGIVSCNDATSVNNHSVRKIVPSSSSFYKTPPDGYCLKFIYDKSDDPGYLLYYTYTYAQATASNPAVILPVIGYKHGNTRIIEEVEEPIKTGKRASVYRSCTTSPSFCSILINMPVYDSLGDDYGIYLSYLYNTNEAPYNTTPFTYSTSTSDTYKFDRYSI